MCGYIWQICHWIEMFQMNIACVLDYVIWFQYWTVVVNGVGRVKTEIESVQTAAYNPYAPKRLAHTNNVKRNTKKKTRLLRDRIAFTVSTICSKERTMCTTVHTRMVSPNFHTYIHTYEHTHKCTFIIVYHLKQEKAALIVVVWRLLSCLHCGSTINFV